MTVVVTALEVLNKFTVFLNVALISIAKVISINKLT